MYKEVDGNLITMALAGEFDVIAHGCNCMCVQGAGLAPQLVEAFGTDTFPMEQLKYKGWINKLGNIDFRAFDTKTNTLITNSVNKLEDPLSKGGDLIVVNAYTQYNYGKNHSDGDSKPVDYEAIALCMKKINHIFKGKHIGLPRIGCGLAGGNWDVVQIIIQRYLSDCDVTIVNYK